MSQERWDVVLRFLEGPLSYQGDLVVRGPVVRMGASPGPGGLRLEGYRGLDDRQATITAYDGATVAIAPVGPNQVRVAEHENVDWNDVAPLRGPTYLYNGSVFHLGPPGRGVTAMFVECRRLGVWEQGVVRSDASQVDPDVQPSDVKQIDADKGRPVWFIPLLVMVGIAAAVAVVIPIIQPPEVSPIGPVDAGEEYYKYVDISEPVDPALKEGFNQPFNDFVMALNADAAKVPALTRPAQWDQRFLDAVTRSAEYHAKAWRFWGRLEEITDDYAFVVGELRKAKMPEVLAAIPYQESGYRSSNQSPACGQGYWQFLPEVANRVEVEVRGCKLRGSEEKWTPTRVVPVIGVLKNAVYMDKEKDISDRAKCRINGCDVDERMDLQASTRGAIVALGEAVQDPEFRASGAMVQLTILSHNAGYDNSRFEEKKVNRINILPSLQAYLRDNKISDGRAPDFYGKNITCLSAEEVDRTQTCGSYLWKETQHYAFNIVAQHILAVCYYAKNYGSQPAFSPWRDYVRGDGYCTRFQIPDIEQVKQRGGATGSSGRK